MREDSGRSETVDEPDEFDFEVLSRLEPDTQIGWLSSLAREDDPYAEVVEED